jgi:hypothetical protein
MDASSTSPAGVLHSSDACTAAGMSSPTKQKVKKKKLSARSQRPPSARRESNAEHSKRLAGIPASRKNTKNCTGNTASCYMIDFTIALQASMFTSKSNR